MAVLKLRSPSRTDTSQADPFASGLSFENSDKVDEEIQGELNQGVSLPDAPEVSQDEINAWRKQRQGIIQNTWDTLKEVGKGIKDSLDAEAERHPDVDAPKSRTMSPDMDIVTDPTLMTSDAKKNLARADKESKLRIAAYPKAVKRAWTVASKQMELGKLGNLVLTGEHTDETSKQIKALQKEIKTLVKDSQKDPYEANAFGTIAPYIVESTLKGGKGYMVGSLVGGLAALAGGQLGPQAATPEEVWTVPLAAAAGGKVGAMFYSVENMRQIEAGSMYIDLVDAGVAEGTARFAAQAYGMGSAGLEMAQFQFLKRLIPGGDRLAKNSINKAITQTLRKYASNKAVRAGAGLAVTSGGEASIEATQELVGNITTLAAKYANDELEGTDLSPKTKEQFIFQLTQGVADAFGKTAVGFGIAGVPGAAINTQIPVQTEPELVAADLDKTYANAVKAGKKKPAEPVAEEAPVAPEQEAQPEPTPEPTPQTEEEVVEEQASPEAPRKRFTGKDIPDNKEDAIKWWQGTSKPKQRDLEQEINEWEQHLAELKKTPQEEKTPEMLEQEAEAGMHLSLLNNLMGFKEEAKDPMKFNEHTGKFTQADLTTPATQSLDGTIHTAPEGEETLSRPFKASEPGKIGDELEAKYAQIPRKGARRGFKHPETGKFIPGEAVVKKAKLDKKAKEAKLQREADLRQGEVENTFKEWGEAIKQQESDRTSRPATPMDEEFFTTPFKKRSTVQKVLRKLANSVSRGPLGKHFNRTDAEQSALMQGWLLISQKSAEEIEYFTNNPDSPEAKAFRRELFGTVMNRLRQERSAKLAEKIGGVSRKDVDKMLAAGQTLPTPQAYEEGVGSQSPLESKESLETQRQQADDDLLSAQRKGNSILDKYFGGDKDITAGKIDLRKFKGKSYKLKIAALRKRIQKLPPEDRPKAVSIVNFVEQNSTKGKNVIYPGETVSVTPKTKPKPPKTAAALPAKAPGQQVLEIPRQERKIDLNVREFENQTALKRDADLIRSTHKSKAAAVKALYGFMRNTGEVSAKIGKVGNTYKVYIPKPIGSAERRVVSLNVEHLHGKEKKKVLDQQLQKIEDEIAVRKAGVVNVALLPSETEAQRDARVKNLLATQRKILAGETREAKGHFTLTPEQREARRQVYLKSLDAKQRAELEERQKKYAEKAKLEKERLLKSTGRRVLIWDSIKTEEQLIHEAREQDKADQRRKVKRSHDREAVKRRLSEKEAELKEMGKRAKAAAKTRRQDQIAKDLELAGKSRKQRQKVLKAEKEGKVQPKPKEEIRKRHAEAQQKEYQERHRKTLANYRKEGFRTAEYAALDRNEYVGASQRQIREKAEGLVFAYDPKSIKTYQLQGEFLVPKPKKKAAPKKELTLSEKLKQNRLNKIERDLFKVTDAQAKLLMSFVSPDASTVSLNTNDGEYESAGIPLTNRGKTRTANALERKGFGRVVSKQPYNHSFFQPYAGVGVMLGQASNKFNSLDKDLYYQRKREKIQETRKKETTKAAPVKSPRRTVKSMENDLLRVLNEEKGEINISAAADMVNRAWAGVASKLDVEHPYVRINAKDTGRAMKGMQSREETEVDRGIRQTKVFRKVLDKIFPKGKVSRRDMALITLLAEDPNFRFKPRMTGKGKARTFDPVMQDLRAYLTPEKRKQLLPAAEWLRNFFEDSRDELSARGLEVDWQGVQIREIAEQMQGLHGKMDISSGIEYEKLSKQLSQAGRTKFVSIPYQVWTLGKLQDVIKATDPKERRQKIQALRSEIAKQRKNKRIANLVQRGVLDLEQINPFEIILSYAKKKGVDFALADVRDAAEKEGLLKYTKTKPKTELPHINKLNSWDKVPDTLSGLSRLKLVDGKYVEETPYIASGLLEQIKLTRAAIADRSKWRRFMAMVKMMQFYNPVFLPVYDMYQHAMLRGGLPFAKDVATGKMFKRLASAGKHVWNQSNTYHQAMSLALASKPFGTPFNKIVTRADVITQQMESGKWAGLLKHVLGTMWDTSTGKEAVKSITGFKTLQSIYHGSFHLAWKLDETIRVMSYEALLEQGMEPVDAAQLAATFHGDYASVPAQTRKFLNNIFFTPTFQIAMTKLWYRMAKGAFHTMSGGKGDMQTRYARGLIGVIMINMAFDALMKNWGYEDDEYGVRYVKRIRTRRGPRELVVHYSHPANFGFKWASRIKMGAKALSSDDPVTALMMVARSQYHPALRQVVALIENDKGGGTPIYSPFDHPIERAGDMLWYTITESAQILKEIDNAASKFGWTEDKRSQSIKDADKYLGPMYEWIWRKFAFAYTRRTKRELSSIKAKALRREYTKWQRNYRLNKRKNNREWERRFKRRVRDIIEEGKK